MDLATLSQIVADWFLAVCTLQAVLTILGSAGNMINDIWDTDFCIWFNLAMLTPIQHSQILSVGVS